MTDSVKVDGSQLRTLLDLVGAPKEPPSWAQEQVTELEALLGKPLPRETGEFLLTPVSLYHPDADHPGCAEDFLCGLPDVPTFLASMTDEELWAQGYFNAVCHFLGLYPLGSQLQYGDFMYAMALLEPHSDELGGVMYYDEREVGGWGPSISAFLLRAMHEFWEQCDGEVDGADQDDVEIELHYLRDCFILDDYDWREVPPSAVDLPEPVAHAFEEQWRSRLEQFDRVWVASFMRGRMEPYNLRDLPTPEQWDEQRALVQRTHHDAMYWLFAHMLLDNREELAECIQLSRENPSKIVAAVADYFQQHPALGETWADERDALFRMVREARASG